MPDQSLGPARRGEAGPRRRTRSHVDLPRDAVAFLMLGPLVGATICSAGLWLFALVLAAPHALFVAYLLGSAPAAVALAVARVSSGSERWASIAPIVAGGLSGVGLALAWGPSSLRGSGQMLSLFVSAGAIASAFSLHFAERIRNPVRHAVAIAAVEAACCALWYILVGHGLHGIRP